MGIEVHFWTEDVARAIDFYTNTLGFNLDFRQPDDGAPGFCVMSFEGSTVMFGLFSKVPPASPDRNDTKLWALITERAGSPGAVAIYIQSENIQEHYEGVRKRGGEIIEELWTAPWGQRQFTLLDPDGNILTFYSPPSLISTSFQE